MSEPIVEVDGKVHLDGEDYVIPDNLDNPAWREGDWRGNWQHYVPFQVTERWSTFSREMKILLFTWAYDVAMFYDDPWSRK